MSAHAEFAYASATELAALIRQRLVSPVELLDSVIERIEQRNPSLNAFVYPGFDDARAARPATPSRPSSRARRSVPCTACRRRSKTCSTSSPAGSAPSAASVRSKTLVVDAYCAFAERIERAGAILLGKTNSPMMGFRGTCDNYLFGPTRNPFDRAKNTGGSSGGSAAAVADGLVPLAEGTDGGGSIRIPAAWCSVYGYKPAFGRVPWSRGPTPSPGRSPSSSRARSRARSKTPPWR